MILSLQRSDWPLLPHVHFLNHGSFGATPLYLLAHQQEWRLRLEQQPVLFHLDLPALMLEARTHLAAFLTCGVNDVVYVENSTFGCNVAFHALASMVDSSSHIVTTDHEYGACMRALHNHVGPTGASVVVVNVPLPIPSQADVAQRIIDAFTPQTKAVFLSHITSPTGARMPVEAVVAEARKRGIISIIDGSHVPGQLPLDLTALDADVYTANCHKWMCTPKGSAFLFVHPRIQDRVPPLVTSWGMQGTGLRESTFVDEHEYLGTRDPSAFLTVPEAIRWMNKHRWNEVQAYSQQLARTAIDALVEDGHGIPVVATESERSLQMDAIVLSAPVDVVQLKRTLYQQYDVEVVVHTWQNVPIVRVSAHAHTSQADCDALRTALRAELQ